MFLKLEMAVERYDHVRASNRPDEPKLPTERRPVVGDAD